MIGADVEVAAALLANHDQQADMMIHEWFVFSVIRGLILEVWVMMIIILKQVTW